MKKKTLNTKLTITWGLPGSGKSTFCKDYESLHKNEYCYVIEHDNIRFKNDNKGYISFVNTYINSDCKHILLDTLIMSNIDIINLLSKLELKNIKEIDIQYWIPNVGICLWNDKYRRDISSEITIKNSTIEEPDLEKIINALPDLKNISLKIIKNKIMHKEAWKVFADKYKIHHNNGMVKSQSWCLGGTSGNCWNDSLSNISGDAPLTSFKEFDDLLIEVCPSMGILQYKKLYNECVSSDTYGEGDYYGGRVTYAHFQFSVSALYSNLIDLNLIKEFEYEEIISK